MLNKISKFSGKYTGIIIFVAAFFSRIILIGTQKVINWDTAVYLMNAKWFAGQHVYFEILRAPLWPFFLSLFYRIGITNETFFVFISLLISALTVFVVYYVANDFFGKRVGILSAVVFAVLPVNIFWSPFAYTELPAALLALLAILFAKKGIDNGEYIYVSVLFSALSFLTRNTMFVVFPCIVLFLLLKRKITVKMLLLSALIFAAIIAPWLVYNQVYYNNPLAYVQEQLKWSGQPNSIFYYAENVLIILGPAALLIIPGFFCSLKYCKENKLQLLLIFVIAYLALATITPHKEERYLLPVLPALAIFSCYIFRDFWNKKTFWLCFTVLALTAALSYTATFKITSDISSFDGIIKVSTGLSGNVASVYWTQTAYYGNVTAYALPATAPELKDWIKEMNISYIIVSDKATYPDYAANASFFGQQDYLVLEKGIFDNYQNFSLYKTNFSWDSGVA